MTGQLVGDGAGSTGPKTSGPKEYSTAQYLYQVSYYLVFYISDKHPGQLARKRPRDRSTGQSASSVSSQLVDGQLVGRQRSFNLSIGQLVGGQLVGVLFVTHEPPPPSVNWSNGDVPRRSTGRKTSGPPLPRRITKAHPPVNWSAVGQLVGETSD